MCPGASVQCMEVSGRQNESRVDTGFYRDWETGLHIVRPLPSYASKILVARVGGVADKRWFGQELGVSQGW